MEGKVVSIKYQARRFKWDFYAKEQYEAIALQRDIKGEADADRNNFLKEYSSARVEIFKITVEEKNIF